MKKGGIVLVAFAGVLLLGALGYFVISHYGSLNYEWKTNLNEYKVYHLLGSSTLSGYIKADGEISVYILTKEAFEKMKRGEHFEYYKAWEHVKSIEFNDVKIPQGDYILVVKNEENKMQWISVKLREKKSA
ncbi:hypothetical protein E3E31_07725 [Thermococcus sp. M39]|uniref:hypothetical protein n=1 Tax=unclassified Thermococcus TaxID=2627626 RepID=UPI00143AC01D|nr:MULTISPECIES: hypothetical protein [unclassified Thermococcus]NJE08411.1 hypothetical protein [Thermococcus sp. M39]NJE11913.1 hypothetical protein [Thermococcus sp. LS2]